MSLHEVLVFLLALVHVSALEINGSLDTPNQRMLHNKVS